VKNIFIVAHPEASHHPEGIVGGWFDSDLTERGARHADDIAKALSRRLRATAPATSTSLSTFGVISATAKGFDGTRIGAGLPDPLEGTVAVQPSDRARD